MMMHEEMGALKVDRNLFAVMARCELLTQVLDMMRICMNTYPQAAWTPEMMPCECAVWSQDTPANFHPA
jgi:hypothetical protein